MRNLFLVSVLLVSKLLLAADEVPFKVVVYDKSNRYPIPGAEVKLQDLSSLREYKVLANDSGFTHFKLDKNTRYRLEVSKNSSGASVGYLSYSYMLSEKEVVSTRVFEAELEKVKHHDSGLMPAIYFDFKSASLSTENQHALDNILKMLETFPTLQMEIGVYTDCREDKDITGKRARNITDYLVSKDITKRVVVKEYGNVRALNQCDCSSTFTCSEEKYLENRRAEFKVLSF